jgi:hypothetical protein
LSGAFLCEYAAAYIADLAVCFQLVPMMRLPLSRSRKFDEPIPPPDDRQLITLKDAGDYITTLPEAEHTAPDWQAAMEALMLNATIGGHTLLARVGVLRALNRHDERVFDTSRKETHWGKRKLKRDQ